MKTIVIILLFTIVLESAAWAGKPGVPGRRVGGGSRHQVVCQCQP